MTALATGADALRAAEARLLDRLARTRVVPVVAVDDGDQAEALARALLAGGIACIEVTFRTPAAAEAIRRAAAVEGMLVGAGTVLSVQQVAEAADAGAHFAVAPGTDEEVVAAAHERGLPFLPGVATATEIGRARRLGLRALKVFPASAAGGPEFLKAVTAVFPDVRFMPTGGVSPATLGDYLAVPSVLAVGGSWLAKPELLRAGRYDEIERLAREALETAT
jgi:2-dehydro-3-deoxyphosphogluconate aldolase/(4S)-4-hydroxy-2-oxoglutarate aldolase